MPRDKSNTDSNDLVPKSDYSLVQSMLALSNSAVSSLVQSMLALSNSTVSSLV